MNMLKMQFELLETLHPYQQMQECANPKCNSMIQHENPCFFDSIFNRELCMPCGKSLRYRRKKAHERGEELRSVELN